MDVKPEKARSVLERRKKVAALIDRNADNADLAD
jgi:hypothetical protein